MKQISKKNLDSLIHLERQIWETSDEQAIKARYVPAKAIDEESNIDWLAICDFVGSIVKKYRGISPGADNETIYKALNVFGWEVVEDGEVNPAV